jgi:GNAT superfamily N-acetyltransferase
LAEEIDRIAAYYREHDGGFWVAIRSNRLVGTFGLERASPDAIELRRMYVDAAARRKGIGRRMLQYAEDELPVIALVRPKLRLYATLATPGSVLLRAQAVDR